MIRAGLVLLAMTMAGTAQAGCVGEDKDHVVLARQGITLMEDRFPFTFPAVVRQVVGESSGEAASGHMMYLIEGIEITVFADDFTYPCDAPLLDVTIKGANTGRIDPLNYPWFQGFDVVTEWFGGSGSHFDHHIFARIGNKFVDVTPPGEIGHTNMGGFYFGPLGQGRSNGFAIWEADWTDGTHYDPHPYKAAFYQWDGSAFRASGETSNPKKYEITPAATTPDFIGLPKGSRFDQTMPYAGMSLIWDFPPQ